MTLTSLCVCVGGRGRGIKVGCQQEEWPCNGLFWVVWDLKQPDILCRSWDFESGRGRRTLLFPALRAEPLVHSVVGVSRLGHLPGPWRGQTGGLGLGS